MDGPLKITLQLLVGSTHPGKKVGKLSLFMGTNTICILWSYDDVSSNPSHPHSGSTPLYKHVHVCKHSHVRHQRVVFRLFGLR